MNVSEKLFLDSIGSTNNDTKQLWASDEMAYVKTL